MKYLCPFLQKYKRSVTAIAVLILTCATASSKLVGNLGAVDPFLSVLINPLDQHGIDVVGGSIDSAPLGARPRVASLEGVPALKTSRYATARWMKDFRKGIAGFVTAVPSDVSSPTAQNMDEFVQKWQQTDQSKRVFISFTARDAEIAARIKSTLEANGYIAFTFINSSGEKPKYNATFIGTMFSQAGHY